MTEKRTGLTGKIATLLLAGYSTLIAPALPKGQYVSFQSGQGDTLCSLLGPSTAQAYSGRKSRARKNMALSNLMRNKVTIDESIATYSNDEFERFSSVYESQVKGTPLKDTSRMVWYASLGSNINPYFIASIILHETGGGKSRALRKRNNVAGLTGRKGYIRFEDPSQSIMYLVSLISNRYVGQGRTTPVRIGQRYAADGGWARKVAAKMSGLYAARNSIAGNAIATEKRAISNPRY